MRVFGGVNQEEQEQKKAREKGNKLWRIVGSIYNKFFLAFT